MSPYQLLGAKFCHDIATPINALGLTLEMLGSDGSMLSLTQQSHQAIVNMLNLYRILFAQVPPPLATAIKAIQQTCAQKGVHCAANIAQYEGCYNVGQIVMCLFFHILPKLSANDSLLIEQVPNDSGNRAHMYEIVCELSNHSAIMTLQLESSDLSANSLSANSKHAPFILLNHLLREAGLSILTEGTELERGARVALRICIGFD